MMVPAVTRAQVITELTKYMDTVVRVEDQLVVATYGYIPVNPQGISPFLSVVPSGSNRQGSTSKRTSAMYFVNVYWFVLFSSKTATINVEESWNRLNEIEQAVAEAIRSVYHTDLWTSIIFTERSMIDTMTIENHGYLMEAVPLQVNVH